MPNDLSNTSIAQGESRVHSKGEYNVDCAQISREAASQATLHNENLRSETAVKQGSSNEWYTPARYVEAAREVMGNIDLDPASCEFANRTVRADHIYTKETNGLDKPWFGRVWLNPPFARRQTPGEKTNQGIWIQKLVTEHWAMRTKQAVLLTTCRPDTSWFHLLWNFPICFADHKVGFYLPEEGQILQEHSHAHGTLFVYMGANETRFTEVFSRFGRIVRAIDTPKPRPVARELWECEEAV